MTSQSAASIGPLAQAAVDDLEKMIRGRFPAAHFAVARGEDPKGVYLKVTVDLDDVEEIVDQELQDRLFDLQVEQGVPVYIIPLHPRSRVLAEIDRHHHEPTASLARSDSSLTSGGTGAGR
jgi:hypothetical protein